MRSSKPIEISKASLIGLKAELAKKQEEVQKFTAQNENRYIPAPLQKEKETILTRQNAGVAERNETDIQLDVEEIDLQRKSREMLEAKSRLYDKLQQGAMVTDNKSLYLVDFEQKAAEESQNTVVAGCENKVSDNEATKNSDDEDDDSSALDSEDDWVDYVDYFGRTRRCLRTDLEYMKSKDAQVSEKFEVNKTPVDEQTPEMLSADMHREAMRQQWEEQEKKLLEKGEIHYQDVLFGEARSHGVGYYNFSVEEEERRRQQAALLKLRKETVEEQTEKQRIMALRQQQLQARMKAAHKRRRERLGLPPEEENTEQEQDTTESATEKPEEDNPKEESVEDIEQSIKRAAHVRPWDIGKDGVKMQSTQVMTQEEWVDKKREERPTEFAPPSYTTTDFEFDPSVSFKEHKKTLFFTSKKKQTAQEPEKSKPSAQLDNDSSDSDSDFGPSVSDWKKQKLSDESNEASQVEEEGAASGHNQIRQDLTDAISAGLNYLRQQADIKQKKKQKGLLDII